MLPAASSDLFAVLMLCGTKILSENDALEDIVRTRLWPSLRC